MKSAIRPAQVSEAIGRRKKNQAAAAQKSLEVKPAFPQGPRDVAKGVGACHHDNLLADFKPFHNESGALRGTFALLNSKLASLNCYLSSSRSEV